MIGKLGLNSIKGLFSKDNLLMGAGVVASLSVTRLTVAKFGDKLPGLSGSNQAPAQIAYAVLIPGILGIFIRRYSRPVSDGLIIGGIANAAQLAIAAYADPATISTIGLSEYLDRGRSVRGLSAPLNMGTSMRATGGAGVMASQSPFPGSNW